MDKITRLMKELNEAYHKKDWADMCNCIQLELLDALKAKAEEDSHD